MMQGKIKKLLFAGGVIVLLGLLFFGFFYFLELKEQKEVNYIKSLVKNHPDGEKFAQEVLSGRNELKDKDKNNDVSAYLKIGVNLNLLGDKKRALKAYEEALERDPKNILALNNTANIYSDLGQYKKAEEHWLKLIEYYPAKPMFYRSLGYLYRYRLNKRPSEIEAFFRQGLEKTNYHPDLLNWLIAYFQEIGDNYKFVEYANLLQELVKDQKEQGQ